MVGPPAPATTGRDCRRVAGWAGGRHRSGPEEHHSGHMEAGSPPGLNATGPGASPNALPARWDIPSLGGVRTAATSRRSGRALAIPGDPPWFGARKELRASIGWAARP